ncbi:MAG: DUF3106 domain-containing protein [Planctomycetota bacterium]
MKRVETLLFSLGICSLLLATVQTAMAQNGAGALDENRRRWESLSPAEREELRSRFQRFAALPEEEKERLQLRQRILKEFMDSEEAGLEEGARKDLEKMPWRERRKFLLQRVRQGLEQGPQQLRESLRSQDPEAQLPQLLERAAEKSADLFERFLNRLVRSGVISEVEREAAASRFRRASPQERLRLLKDHVMRHPGALGLTDFEARQMQQAEPPEFIRTLLRRLAEGPWVPPSFRLTPEQREQLTGLGPRQRAAKEREFLRQNVLRALEAAGVAGPTIERLLDLPPGLLILEARRLLNREGRVPNEEKTPSGRDRAPLRRQ